MNTIVAQVRFSVKEKITNENWIPYQDILVPISRVPDALRKVNPPYYTPRLVAIGPLHRDNPQLKRMQGLKISFLREFFTMMNNNLDRVITFIMSWIEPIRLCYEETENIPQNNDLCEMMLLDSVFIIQSFLKKERNDPMFDNYCWFRDLMHDFLLIENQIPLVIPYTIYTYHYCKSGGEHNHADFTILADNFFKDVKMASASLPSLAYFSDTSLESVPIFVPKPSHFIEYLMMAYFTPVPSPSNLPSQPVSSQLDSTPPLLPLTQKSNKKGSWKLGVATASRLLVYGVKFEAGTNTTTSLTEIQFEPKDGILKIPPIKVNDWTETLFRNLIAFEHFQPLTPRYVTDYIIFMDYLIDTPQDVKILTNSNVGIIQDDLQDRKEVSELFNDLYKEVITENPHYHFAQLYCDLDIYTYNRDWWHQWKAMLYNWNVILRREYFNSPWSYINIFAFLFSSLAVVQTVCSVLQVAGY